MTDTRFLPHKNSYHYLLANEFWTMRMGDDEPFELFKRRVQRYERRLEYDFSNVPEQQKIDMWIGRLPPKLLDKIRIRTNDLFDLKTLDDLFAVLARMEAADSRIERATQFWETRQEVELGISFLFAQHLEEIPKEQSCFFQDASGQVSTDLLLARIPPRELKMLRERTLNFSYVNTWQDVLEQFRRVAERDYEGRHDADTEADWERAMEHAYGRSRQEIEKEDERPRQFIEKWKAEQDECARREYFQEKLQARRASHAAGPTLTPAGDDPSIRNSTRSRNAARRDRRRRRQQSRQQ